MIEQPLAIPAEEIAQAIDDTAPCADCLGTKLLVIVDPDPYAPDWHVAAAHGDRACPALGVLHEDGQQP